MARTALPNTQLNILQNLDANSHKVVNLTSGTNDNDAVNVSQINALRSSTSPAALGVAAAGSATDLSRSDHVHAMPSATDVGAIASTEKGAANGVAPLGSDSKISTSYLPASVLGAVNYQGTWNADTNSPTIPAAASGNKGYYYKVSTAGATDVDGITDWKIGDWIVSNGTAWEKIDNTDQVTSVHGRQGAVVAAASDYDADQIDFTPAGNLTATDVQAALEELDSEKQSKSLASGFVLYGVSGVAEARRLVKQEVPTANGTFEEYTLAYTPVVGTEDVFVNGLLMERGASADYTIDAGTKKVTMASALTAGDKVRVSYLATN